jgi:hypothetical protein
MPGPRGGNRSGGGSRPPGGDAPKPQSQFRKAYGAANITPAGVDGVLAHKAFGPRVVAATNLEGTPLPIFLKTEDQPIEEAVASFIRGNRSINQPADSDVAAVMDELYGSVPAIRQDLQARLAMEDQALLNATLQEQTALRNYAYYDRIEAVERAMTAAKGNPALAEAMLRQMGVAAPAAGAPPAAAPAAAVPPAAGTTVTVAPPGAAAWFDAPVELTQGVPVLENVTQGQAAMAGTALGGVGAAFLMDYLFGDEQPVVVQRGAMA